MKRIAIILLTGLLAGAMGTAMAGDAAAGKALAKKCKGCHGKKGEGRGKNPKLAGQSADELVKDLHAFKDGSRKNKMMQRMVKKLSDDDMENLAAYFAGMK